MTIIFTLLTGPLGKYIWVALAVIGAGVAFLGWDAHERSLGAASAFATQQHVEARHAQEREAVDQDVTAPGGDPAARLREQFGRDD